MIHAGLIAILLGITCHAAIGQSVPDVRFMQGMIHHHAQALEMTELVPERSSSEKIHLLARRIEISQQDEIAWMRDWLAQHGIDVPGYDRPREHDGHGDYDVSGAQEAHDETAPLSGAHDAHDAHEAHGESAPKTGSHTHAHEASARPLMPGMLTEAEMAQLASATGTEFDRLFLQFMIFHHEGALTMVEDLFSAPGAAQETSVFRFASGVDSDQRGEIRRMQGMLDALIETEHKR
jgi:uncharacterized protein (DUF305 family)